ncbi:MAG: phosphate ABC transporter substrate-binding protein [Lactimicrobium massiliense]
MNRTKGIIAGLLTAAMLAGCGSSTTAASTSAASTAAAKESISAVSGTVTAAGSSALLPLAQEAATEFMKNNPDCVVTVNGGGSGEGLKQVADGSVDIGNSDVAAEEKLDASAASGLTDHEVALVAMAPVVSKDLDIDNLTTDQLIQVFTGKVTNWKDVGGPDEDIVLVTRPSSSGTRATFKKYALNGEEEASNQALETDDSGTLTQTVATTEGAIGYVALSYLTDNTDLKAVSIDGVEPTLENVYSGDYKVWSYEHMYTKGDGSEAAQAFLKYMVSDEFASNVEKMGYGVVASLTDAAVATHKN